MRLLIKSAMLFSMLVAGAVVSSPAQEIDFVRDVQPILKSACYSCHGPEKQKGALRLDSKQLTFKGGQSGVCIVPGQSKTSYFMQRVRGEGDEVQMPEKAPPLSKEQIATLATWIDQGANWPDSASVIDASVNVHWAYVPPKAPAIPDVSNKAWVRNPIDSFVLARLDKEKMQPAPEAAKETLIRRVSLDLTGLPPTPAELDAFMKDTGADAYEKLVDRLLASPQYGERWARVWLDLARYADTDGFNFDSPRVMWKYRDWVINSLNKDVSFKQFTLDQIAGDLMPKPTPEQLVACGFHRNTMKNSEGGVDPEEARWETLLDRTNTTAAVWLGSTMGCAQCHNHKYDPFTQRDYYGMLAFFDNSDEIAVLADSGEPVKAGKPAKAPAKPAAKNAKPAEPAEGENPEGEMADKKDSRVTALTFKERAGVPATYLRIRGAFTSKGEKVSAATPKFLAQLPKDAPRNRLGLAEWLTSPENPLTARVTVNRFWETIFGRGLVATSEDFGTQGERPTHPELLDWLAVEFVKGGWKMKALQRLIVTSATYRQSSRVTTEMLQCDPANKLYARGSRYRLEAEMLRDSALSSSGLISLKVGGPSVYPPAPSEVGQINNNKVSSKWTPSPGADRFRRSLYTYARRTAPFAMLSAFDAPSREFCCLKRARTNTPMQALTGLNDPMFFECAQGLAARLYKEGGKTSSERLQYGFRLCTSRAPSQKELEALTKAFESERANYVKNTTAADELLKSAVPMPKVAAVEKAELAALVMLSNVLLNLDESVTRE